MGGPTQAGSSNISTEQGEKINVEITEPVDEDGNIKVSVENEANTNDNVTHSVLCSILKQLKVMNIHLSLITNNKVENYEVD